MAMNIKNSEAHRMATELLEIGQRCAAHMKPPVAAKDHATLLYDRAGLPK